MPIYNMQTGRERLPKFRETGPLRNENGIIFIFVGMKRNGEK
jgi:hypothetical protein